MNTKKIVITTSLLLLLAGGSVLAYFLLHKPAKKAPATQQPTSQVSGLDSTPTPLSNDTKSMVQTYVDTTLETKHGKGEYPASFRAGSYKRVVTPDGGIIMTLLVDVPQTKETYLFTKTGADNSPIGTSYLRCAPEADQLVHPSVCKDIGNDS